MCFIEPSVDSLAARIQRFAPVQLSTPAGLVVYRQAGLVAQGVTHVLLHGIGSGSASWLMQLEAAALTVGAGVLAWEAPGYGCTSAVAPLQPDAGDYANRLWSWLDTLGIQQPITLVGHSLGALMATRAAVQRPERVRRLVLLAPAQGYARASEDDRAKRLSDRLANLQALGPLGMAQKRGAAMLSPQAAPELLAYVQSAMAQVQVAGYAQASQLLSGGDLLTDLANVSCPIAVASGQADSITPVAGCQMVASTAGVPWTDLGDAGHACALDAPGPVNALLGLTGQQPFKAMA